MQATSVTVTRAGYRTLTAGGAQVRTHTAIYWRQIYLSFLALNLCNKLPPHCLQWVISARYAFLWGIY